MVTVDDDESFNTLADLPEFNSFDKWETGMYRIKEGVLRVEVMYDKRVLLCFFDHGGMPLYRVTAKKGDGYYISHFDYQTMEFLAWEYQRLQ